MLSPQSTQIRNMFSAIAYRYDLLNHLLSFNIDKLWRRKAVARLASVLKKSNGLCLDLCCGTGDLALTMSHRGVAQIVACDFSHPMLQLSLQKISKRNQNARIRIIEADGLRLPFRSQLIHPLDASMLKGLIPDGQHFVNQKDLRIQVCCDGKPQPHLHT